YRIAEALLHPFKLLLTTLPWSLLALYSLSPRFYRQWDARGRFLLQALHCWTWPNMIVWSLMTEHTPRHSFPLFPGIAGLAIMVWIAWFTGRMSWPLRRVSALRFFTAALALWLTAKAVFVFAIMPVRNASRQPQAKGALLA